MMYVILLLTYNNFYGIFIPNLKGEVMDVKEWAKTQEYFLNHSYKPPANSCNRMRSLLHFLVGSRPQGT